LVCSASSPKGVGKKVKGEGIQGGGNSCFQRETEGLGHGFLNRQREERESYWDFQIKLIREKGNCTLPPLLKESRRLSNRLESPNPISTTFFCSGGTLPADPFIRLTIALLPFISRML